MLNYISLFLVIEQLNNRIFENMADLKNDVIDSNSNDETENIVLNRECLFHIGNTRYVKGTFWNNEWNIHVRQYEWSSAGILFPTKMGIALSLLQWVELLCNLTTIEQTLKDFQEGKTVKLFMHLGSNVYLSVTNSYRVVDIRKWWIPDNEDELKPTRKGIALTFQEWQSLVNICNQLAEEIPEIKQTIPCSFGTDHSNLLSAMQCRNCCPNEEYFIN